MTLISYYFDPVDAISEIETLAANFTKDKDNSLKGRTTLLQIQRLFGRCQELGDEKIYIVQQVEIMMRNFHMRKWILALLFVAGMYLESPKKTSSQNELNWQHIFVLS